MLKNNMFKRKLTKEEHIHNMQKIREYLQIEYPEYEIYIEKIEFFYEMEMLFTLKAGFKKE